MEWGKKNQKKKFALSTRTIAESGMSMFLFEVQSVENPFPMF